jgi:phage tail protein X
VTVAFPDSIAVAFPDSIAVAFVPHLHQYHRDRLYLIYINIIGKGCTSFTFTTSAQAGINDSIAVVFPDSIAVAFPDCIAVAFLRHAHQLLRDRLYLININIIGTGFTK